ncbi:MAG: phosphodiester glycosidase family protein [Methylovirgula sp.]|uniref:phosphodiester glycosidase family protein n=1 Tax=Methylovirgula sp. TaxID=1978224 RepID=UPI00307624B0
MLRKTGLDALLLRIALGAILLSSALASAHAQESGPCNAISEGGQRYTICTFDVRRARLRLFLAGADGKPYSNFAAIAEALKSRGDSLAFAMNAGMFGTDYRPIGLYVEGGRQLMPANTRAGSGNFHLKPNGIFYFDARHAGIMETSRYLEAHLHPEYATQSGPMLVIEGALHPKIEASGTSQKIRNGVGVRDGHIVVFAISDDPVTFYQFATLFRDRLNCPNALFLDGSVSSLYAPAVGRDDALLPLGPIIGVVNYGVR